MRQTLFYIPHEIAGIPVFGLGWLLGLWVVLSVILTAVQVTRRGWNTESWGLIQFQLLVAAAIWWVAPRLEVLPYGLPIRGYGMMMLLGVVAGAAASMHWARKVGIDPERILTLLVWFFVAGIGGARLFYVIQKFETFRRDTWGATLVEVFRFTEGGLVVYGALLGAALAFVLFVRRYRLPALRLADVVAPGLMIGLAFGRIGCLLNGCCYGGLCPEGPVAITFPRFSAPERQTLSPPYQDHLTAGQLHGVHLVEGQQGVEVAAVVSGSAAAEAGVQAGIVLRALNGRHVETLEEAGQILYRAGPDMTLIDQQQRSYHWTIGNLPARSLPVHPSQLYSAWNALLIFVLAWCYFPFRRRDGEVFGLVMTIYPVTRFLLEVIRSDEAGQFGTWLTISQWVSLGILCVMAAYWIKLASRPRLQATAT